MLAIRSSLFGLLIMFASATVVVENRLGAGGLVESIAGAKSKPDGTHWFWGQLP